MRHSVMALQRVIGSIQLYLTRARRYAPCLLEARGTVGHADYATFVVVSVDVVPRACARGICKGVSTQDVLRMSCTGCMCFTKSHSGPAWPGLIDEPGYLSYRRLSNSFSGVSSSPFHTLLQCANVAPSTTR